MQKNQPTLRSPFGLALGLFALLALGAAGDVIHLKNGRSIEGVVQEENDQRIVVQVGVGEVRLRRSQVSRIERAAGEDAERLQQSWQRKYFAHENYVPEEIADLASEFRRLETMRGAAAGSVEHLHQLSKRSEGNNRAVRTLRGDLEQASRRLESAKPENDRQAYVKTITEYNRLTARLNLVASEELAAVEEVERYTAKVSDYGKNLAAYASAFGRRRDELMAAEPAAATVVFLEEAGRRIDSFQREFLEVEVPIDEESGHVVVMAAINGRTRARLLLDTGATTVSISEDLARRAGISTESLPRFPVRLADGETIDVPPVLLSSVQVGESKVNQVPAVVLPRAPGPGVDGLLGMSFLRHYLVELDPANGKLVLKSFNPGGAVVRRPGR
jgi:clan AA aspartic protease (TIGR02281 family)